MWIVRAGWDDGELRPCHYIYVYIIESRLIRRVTYESKPKGDLVRHARERDGARSNGLFHVP